MKKLLLLLSMFCFCCIAKAESWPADFSKLPERAQKTVKKYFDSAETVTYDDKEHTYRVVCKKGDIVTFDEGGNWRKIDLDESTKTPTKLIPENIQKYLKRKYPSQKLVMIEKTLEGKYIVLLYSGKSVHFKEDGNIDAAYYWNNPETTVLK